MKKAPFILVLILTAISVKAQWNDSGSDLTTSDNVGIGVTSPQTKLHLEGNLNGWFQTIKATVTNNEEFVGIRLHTGYFGEYSKWAGLVAVAPGEHGNSPALGFYSAQSEQMRLLSNGNLGIGTKSPQAKLHLEGDINGWFQSIKGTVTNNEEFVGIKLHTGYFGEYNKWAGLVAVAPGEHGNSPALGFYSGQTENMRLLGNGNLGIGITDPKNKLSVNGTIWATEVKVSLTDGADWVFENNYKLRTLEDVEEFVKENKHLPEIPSAEEFRQNDLNVAEMTNKLLQKIEELTLYLIEQNKHNLEQQELIEELQKEVSALKEG